MTSEQADVGDQLERSLIDIAESWRFARVVGKLDVLPYGASRDTDRGR